MGSFLPLLIKLSIHFSFQPVHETSPHMPAPSNYRPFFWIVATVFFISLFYQMSSANRMDSLDFSFKIEINGQAIAEIGNSGQSLSQATVGPGAPAIFTLKEGRLRCGEWILSRKRVEDRSFAPKQVVWFKVGTESEEQAQPVTANQEGEDYQIKFGNAGLKISDGKVFADLLGDGSKNTVVKV
ncbi:hypothetical protein IAQ61_007642 [Plenodomus lingam]|uniref:uncharacterized protein n=1 Tax=Leptosphaeria maculans TaxID=5022 RepID=UPI003319CA52|nr:hypothetical protein IAQ61_007642 [Plenodomus lingam]